MKKALLTGIISMAFSVPVMAGKVNVQGWSGFDPDPQLIKDNLMDDDATGKSLGDGDARDIVIRKPNTNINAEINNVNCDNAQFSALCEQLNVKMNAYVLAKSNSDQSYAKQVATAAKDSAEKHADNRADIAERNANNYTGSVINSVDKIASLQHKQSLENADLMKVAIDEHIANSKGDLDEYVEWIRNDIAINTTQEIAAAQSAALNKNKEYLNHSKNYTDRLYAALKSIKPRTEYIYVTTSTSTCNSSIYNCNSSSSGGGGGAGNTNATGGTTGQNGFGGGQMGSGGSR